jgi:hypothetical protein
MAAVAEVVLLAVVGMVTTDLAAVVQQLDCQALQAI